MTWCGDSRVREEKRLESTLARARSRENCYFYRKVSVRFDSRTIFTMVLLSTYFFLPVFGGSLFSLTELSELSLRYPSNTVWEKGCDIQGQPAAATFIVKCLQDVLPRSRKSRLAMMEMV